MDAPKASPSRDAARRALEMAQPPSLRKADGEVRRIGVEIEFAGLNAADAAALVQRTFGGRVRAIDPHRFAIDETRFGPFRVELDTIYAHPEDWADDIARFPELQEVAARLMAAFGDVSSLWTPVEIIGPPTPLDALPELEAVTRALREAGAEGTDQGLLFAFGTQLNIDPPALDARVVAAYLKAFLLLEDWLRADIDLDRMRRALPFIDPFPERYACAVVDPRYWPDAPRLIDDYLDANPTRNRDLDMLPLFAHLDEARVAGRLSDRHVRSRPALHYRLPDTRLSDPQWGLVVEWNRWAWVERLAADADALAVLGDALRSLGRGPAWMETIDQWRAQAG